MGRVPAGAKGQTAEASVLTRRAEAGLLGEDPPACHESGGLSFIGVWCRECWVVRIHGFFIETKKDDTHQIFMNKFENLYLNGTEY